MPITFQTKYLWKAKKNYTNYFSKVIFSKAKTNYANYFSKAISLEIKDRLCKLLSKNNKGSHKKGYFTVRLTVRRGGGQAPRPWP